MTEQEAAAQVLLQAETVAFFSKVAFGIISGVVLLISALLFGQSKGQRKLFAMFSDMKTKVALVEQKNGHIDEKYDTIIDRFNKLDIRIDELITDKKK